MKPDHSLLDLNEIALVDEDLCSLEKSIFFFLPRNITKRVYGGLCNGCDVKNKGKEKEEKKNSIKLHLTYINIRRSLRFNVKSDINI